MRAGKEGNFRTYPKVFRATEKKGEGERGLGASPLIPSLHTHLRRERRRRGEALLQYRRLGLAGTVVGVLLQAALLRDSREEEAGNNKKTKHKTKEVTRGGRGRAVVRDLVLLLPSRCSKVQVGEIDEHVGERKA